jgi:hypothetical protein
MPGAIAHNKAVELLLIGFAAVLVAVLGWLAYRAWQRSRISAEERERRRCAHIVAIGKITEALLVEIKDNLVYYSYDVQRVEYTASQDLSRFAGDPGVNFTGVCSMSTKYDPRNPANSIVVAEEWNGLHGANRFMPGEHAKP